jgi:nucleobase:cation symporter-1, NCS1 family
MQEPASLSAAQPPIGADLGLWNSDLAATGHAERSWDWKAFAALWVSMVVCVPAYLLASGLIEQGMSWGQAVLTILLGNVIILGPMLLIGHAGAKHGLPFPVLLRASFGTQGAKIPALARGIVACGWFGINTWVGGQAIYVIVNTMAKGALAGPALPLLGIDAAQLICFLLFWALHLYFIHNGTKSIKWFEQAAAPFLIAMSLALVVWAYINAHGFGPIWDRPSAFAPGGPRAGQFWPVFFASLTAMVGFWATMALNIPDFTRYAKSQRDQMIGQALGLPIPMALFAMVGIIASSATLVIYGEAIWDPVVLAGKMGGFAVVLALAALAVATLTTNLAANVVAPAFGFANLAPSKISFRMGGYITAGLGIAMFPWKLLDSAGTYLFTWLVGYSALLGPIAGILIADYFALRRTQLDGDDLFRADGRYSANGGWNWAGLLALAIGIAPNLPGFLHAAGLLHAVPALFDMLYGYAWFVGFALGGAAYLSLSALLAARPLSSQGA